MVSLEAFEEGRMELEALLNREVSATEDVRKYEIQCWIGGVKEEWMSVLGRTKEEAEEQFRDRTPQVVESDLKEEPVFIS